MEEGEHDAPPIASTEGGWAPAAAPSCSFLKAPLESGRGGQVRPLVWRRPPPTSNHRTWPYNVPQGRYQSPPPPTPLTPSLDTLLLLGPREPPVVPEMHQHRSCPRAFAPAVPSAGPTRPAEPGGWSSRFLAASAQGPP